MPTQDSLFNDLPDSNTSPKPKRKAADNPSPRRPKKSKAAVDDYYRLLGVGEADPLTVIKQKYVEKVKEYPPETHPEEFQKIRKAFETLRSPELRKEYDLLRSHGESVETLLEKAEKQHQRNHHKQAEKTLRRAVALNPAHPAANLALAAHLLFHNGNLPGFEAQFSALQPLIPPEEWPDIWIEKITMLAMRTDYEAAFGELQKFKAAYPRGVAEYWSIYGKVYYAVGQYRALLDELMAQVRALPPSLDALDLYTAWINLAIMADDGNRLSKALNSFERFSKCFPNPEEKRLLCETLLREYATCRAHNNIPRAKVFIGLAANLDKSNKDLQEKSRQMVSLDAMLKELERAEKDDSFFPLIIMQASAWIADEFDLEDEYEQFLEDLDPELVEQMEQFNEAYVAGIYRLKKRYPALYRYYQQRWDKLAKENSAGLNREERRGIRI